jgi:hypothetical protein
VKVAADVAASAETIGAISRSNLPKDINGARRLASDVLSRNDRCVVQTTSASDFCKLI